MLTESAFVTIGAVETLVMAFAIEAYF